MKKRMLADVLWKAANEYLQAGPFGVGDGKEPYSCPAVTRACKSTRMPDHVRAFLESLGCSTCRDDLLNRAWKFTEQSQGVRYMWLLLAMHVAEDEGIEV